MFRVKNVELSAISLGTHNEVETTDFEHAMKVARKDKTSGWTYLVEEKKLFGWRLRAAFCNGKRIDECGCRIVY